MEAAGSGTSREFWAYRRTLEMKTDCYPEGHGVEWTETKAERGMIKSFLPPHLVSTSSIPLLPTTGSSAKDPASKGEVGFSHQCRHPQS